MIYSIHDNKAMLQDSALGYVGWHVRCRGQMLDGVKDEKSVSANPNIIVTSVFRHKRTKRLGHGQCSH